MAHEKTKRLKYPKLVATGSMADNSIPPWEVSREAWTEWATRMTCKAFESIGYTRVEEPIENK